MFVLVLACFGAILLAFLPEVGLSHSAQPPVLVGLLLMTFLTESYGWIFTGLIVPGYLAPIFISQPWSGAVIVFEAIITYLIVRGLSDHLSKLGLWADFFGRDGFFAHLVVSLIVRLIFEAWIFPELGSLLVVRFGLDFDYRNHLYSIGLVAVPLLSNMMWKPGLRRGLFLVSVPIGFTYIVTQFVLIPYTNFSVARFDLLYEDVAVDFTASGSHYIIFLIGTILASRTNLAFGWDYGGIVVPGLLALVWNTPLKIFTTFFEAFVIVGVGQFIVSRKMFERITIEGPRKTLLIFTIGFTWKWVVSWVAPYVLPEFRPTELYGFGYLLPTIIAGKIWAKSSLALVVVPAVRTSFLAFVLGLAVSIGLATLLPAAGNAGTVATAENSVLEQHTSIYNTLVVDRGRIIPRQARRGFQRPYADELDRFDRAVELILKGIATKERANLERAATILSSLNYETLEIVDDESGNRYLYLREAATEVNDLNGWGIYVFNMNPTNDLVFEVPRPREEWKTLDAAEILFREFNGRALLVSGAHYFSLRSRASDVTRSPRTVYNVVHRRLRMGSIIQIRGQKDTTTELWIQGEFPHEALNLSHLREITGDLPLVWRENVGADPDIQRKSSAKSFLTFNLSLETRRRILARRFVAREVIDAEPKRVSGYLRDWFATEKNAIAGKGSGLYVPPTFSDLLFMDEEIIAPILASQARFGKGYPGDELKILATAAAQLGYELIEYTYIVTGDKYLVLREQPSSSEVVRPNDRRRRHYWGTFVFKLGEFDPLVISVPRPLSEKNTLEAGVQLFEYLNARALMIAGAHDKANLDGKADMLSPTNAQTVFTLFQQTLLRASLGSTTVVFGQIRGFNPTAARVRGGKTVASLDDVEPLAAPSVDRTSVKTEQEAVEEIRSDIVLSTGRELADKRQIPEPLLLLESKFRNLGFSVDYFDGTVNNIRFAERENVQLRQIEDFNNGIFVHIWVNRNVRDVFGDVTDTNRVAEIADALRIEPVTAELDRYVLRRLHSEPSRRVAEGAVARQIIELTREYGRLWNIAYLRQIRHIVDRHGFDLAYVTEPTSRQVYLVYDMANTILVVNLVGKEDGAVVLNRREASAENITNFVRKRQAFLRVDRWVPALPAVRRPPPATKNPSSAGSS
jgi:hypothetical protein